MRPPRRRNPSHVSWEYEEKSRPPHTFGESEEKKSSAHRGNVRRTRFPRFPKSESPVRQDTPTKSLNKIKFL